MNIKNLLYFVFETNKKRFGKICSANKLKLSYGENKKSLPLLKYIFENREYADYFPFYEDVTIVDIGAHFGYFSLFASANVKENSRIIALEPALKNFNLLIKNLSESGIRNVEALNVAVADKEGETKLFHAESVNFSLINNYLNIDNANSFDWVKTISLEKIFNDYRLNKIDFLKMDCEGSEYSIIFNSPEWVFDKIMTISMEFHDIKQPGHTGLELAKRLKTLGFEIVKFNHEKTSMGLNYGKIIATKCFNK